LVEVDAIDLEACQAGFDRLRNDFAREVGAAVADPLAPSRAGDLARDDEAVMPAASEPVAENRFGAPLRPRIRRHRIHLGGIDEVDALIERVVELSVGLGLVVLLAPGHRTEANLGA